MHRATNHAWMATTEQLVAAHGAAVLDFIVRAYRLPWPPQGYPVHIVMYAAWGGAYSTDGSLLVVSSNARAGTTGWSGLETVFHESIHQWDDAVDAILNADARAIAKRLPRNLSHALVFFTAAEAVRHVAPPEYVPLADATGAWSRGMEGLKGALDATWLPYLNGGGTDRKSTRLNSSHSSISYAVFCLKKKKKHKTKSTLRKDSSTTT